ncbi:hypothetical protein C8Q72DRAFT_436452 [Fomitopsis betulina]|nr:hypothetical protein C8Q72DRAFT_436452 [Fomitopsis betulina]
MALWSPTRYDQHITNAPNSTKPFDDLKMALSPPRQLIPLAAPRPGYAAHVTTLNLSSPDAIVSADSRSHSPTTPEMSQVFLKPLTLVEPSPASLHAPHTLHELQPHPCCLCSQPTQPRRHSLPCSRSSSASLTNGFRSHRPAWHSRMSRSGLPH